MTAKRWILGQQFIWKAITYEVKRLLPNGQITIECLSTGLAQSLDLSTLVAALFADELNFCDESSPGQTKQTSERSRPHLLCLDDYPEQWVKLARWRLEVIQPLLGLRPSQRSRKVIDERIKVAKGSGRPDIARRTTLSRASVFRWLHRYEQSNGDLRSLIPEYAKCGGKDNSRVETDVLKIIDTVIEENALQPEKKSASALHQLIAAQIAEENQRRPPNEKLTMPAPATVGRRLATWDPEERYAAVHGKRAARRAFKQYAQTDQPTLPLTRVEIDHTPCDVIVIDENDNLPLGRPTLTHALDLATRYPLGYYLGFEPPSYYTVMECLYQAICPKEDVREKFGTEHAWTAFGVPSTLVVDNGKEFIGQDLTDGCELLGIVLQQCPVMTPEFKAGVERHFRTLNTGIFHTLPGTTFSHLFERGSYDSVQQACISLRELEKALVLFQVDIYSEQFHHGLQGIPARRWEQAFASGFVPRVPPSRLELSVLLGRIARRTLQHYGIEFLGLRYNTSDLGDLRARLRGEQIKLKYHPGDLSRMFIFDPFEKRYIEVPALDQAYTQGLSLWKHRVIRHFAAAEAGTVDLAALGRARRKIQDMVDAARTHKRSTTRKKAARWAEQPPSQPPAPSPPVLSEDAALLKLPDHGGYEYDYALPKTKRSSTAKPRR